jgi:hypothetical protein
LKTKLITTIVLSCSILIFFYLLNQPAVEWQEAGQWQIRVYQKADHMMSGDPPYLTVNELKMDLTRQEDSPIVWRLQIHDINGNQLFPGIVGLIINYSEDLKIVNGYALNDSGQKVMDIDKFFYLSLYGSEFFSPQRKKYQSLALLFNEKIKIELCKEKGRNVWWDKNHPWWIIYESDSPPLKAQLII